MKPASRPAIPPPSDGLEEARQARAEQSWEEGYNALLTAREALLDSLVWTHRFIAEEVGPGVISEAHIKASLQSSLKALYQGRESIEAAWSHFEAYFSERGQSDTLRPEASEEADPDKPISLWPTEQASENQSG